MTINEAISHALEVAEQNDTQAEKWQEEGGKEWGKTTVCRECAADHRQLAEWLMELKDLKAEQNDQYVFIHELMSELTEAKRLLKAAVEDMNSNNICFDINACNVCAVKNCISCDTFHWRYTDEAEKLINGKK